MKFAIFSMLLTVSIIASTYGAIEPKSITRQENELYSVLDVNKEFEAWKAKHNVVYKNAKEEERRKRIWIESRKTVEEYQRKFEKGETSFQVTLNHLADLEPHEYSCWPRKTSCRHRHRLVRSVSGANKKDEVTGKEERARDLEDDRRERERIRGNNKDGRFGG